MGKAGEKRGKVAKSWTKMGFFFAKWPPAAILDDRKSFSIAFLAISYQYATFFFSPIGEFFFKMAAGRHFMSSFGPFWMTENHFRSQVRFAPKTIGFFHYVLSMAMPNMKLIGEFVTQLELPQAF